jgi:uncharacterized membrane protein YgcG
LPLCSGGTVEQPCHQSQLFEDDASAGIIIDPKGILNDNTKRIIVDKLRQYSSTEFYYESSAVNNNNNNIVEPSEAAKVANQTVRVTTTDDIDNDKNSVDNYDFDCHNSEKCIIRVQFAVAIVDDTTFRFNNDYDYDFGSGLLQHDNDNGNNNNNYNVEIMAEDVAKRLHNRLWDVRSNKEEEEEEGKGIETKKGTNKHGMTTLFDNENDANILIYLDIRDRVVFISVDNNPNLRRILTDKRIDRIIRYEMKPYFKNDDYGNGLIKGMEQIVDLLKNNGEEKDKQSMIVEQNLLDFFGWFNNVSGGGGGFLWIILVMLHCYYHLKLKQRKRQQQRVYAQTASELSTQDITHAEELRKTYAKTTNCPICLEDFQSCCIGSDSKPIKILRCGHVFDESCFLEWITCGRGGDITKCPICRSDVGGSNINTNTNNNDNDSDNGTDNYYDSGTLVGNREGNIARWSFTFNRTSSHSPLMARNRSLFTNTSSDDNNDNDNDNNDSITTSSSSSGSGSGSGDSYYAFGGNDDGGTTTSVGGRGGRF